MGSTKHTNGYNVPNLDRALSILELLSRNPRGLTRADLASRLDVPANSVYRVSMTLLERGYLSRDERGKRFRLTDRMLRLRCASMDERGLVALSWDVMRQLRDEISETVALAVLNGARGVVLEQVPGLHDVKLTLDVGHVFDLHAGVPGKAILAFLDDSECNDILERVTFKRHTANTVTSARRFRAELKRVRAQGYAVDREESLLGLNCVGAPVLDAAGRPVAAVFTTAPVHRLDKRNFAKVGRTMIRHAKRITQKLEHGTELGDSKGRR